MAEAGATFIEVFEFFRDFGAKGAGVLGQIGDQKIGDDPRGSPHAEVYSVLLRKPVQKKDQARDSLTESSGL